jgi:hypothetical protein
MDNSTLIVLALVALVIVGGAVVYMQRRRSRAMRSRYGAEYRVAVDQTGDRRKAEAELRNREKRVEAFDLRTLSPREAAEFSDRWRQVQTKFVDDPGAAVGQADELLAEVMRARGYPVSDFEQRTADLSVHHPKLVSDYRIAHDVARRHARGEAGTEDLRKALIHYRALFEDLLAPSAQDRRPEEPSTFMSEDDDHERATQSRDKRDDRAVDDRADRQRRSSGSPDSRAPRI